jgi:O-antigen ligase
MGFALSILYFLTCYLTPQVLFGPLAAYRIELILALILVFVSIPSFDGAIIWKTPQSLAIIGLAIAIFMSVLVGVGWASGGVSAFLLFIPNAFAYYLVCLHCNSKKKFQIVVLMMLFVCLFVIGQGLAEMHRGLPTRAEADSPIVNRDDSYFFGMTNDAREWFYRLRGMGQINDPNDFAQLIICVLPLTFAWWKPKAKFRNLVFVLVPVGVLLWGLYLTHSRGAILALLAVVVVASRKRIGLIPSLILAGAIFAGAMASSFTGGREISTAAGEDRTEFWGEGLQLLKAHPLFGIGFGQMPEYIGHTAHNTIVVCAAELGLFGLYFWSMFVLPSIRDTLVVASPKKVNEIRAIIPEIEPGAASYAVAGVPEGNEINKFGRLVLLSFVGYMVAGWFLSRAFVMTLFLLGGMGEVVFEMGRKRGMVLLRPRMGWVLRYSVVLMIAMVLTMYIVLRIVNLTSR